MSVPIGTAPIGSTTTTTTTTTATSPRWTLIDSQTAETYELEIGPDAGGSLNRSWAQLRIERHTAGPVAVLGQSELDSGQHVSGTLLSQQQLQTMWRWFAKGYPVYLTDDLGRQFQILISGFEPKRVRTASEPWHHTWQLSYTVLAVTDI